MLNALVIHVASIAVYLIITILPSLNGTHLRLSKISEGFKTCLYLFPLLWPLPWNIYAMYNYQPGPTSSIYCGVRCEEDYGTEDEPIPMDGKYNNPSKCWYRLFTLYGHMGLTGGGSALTMAYIGYRLHKQQQMTGNSKASKSEQNLRKAVKKLINFSGITALTVFLAFVSRFIRLLRPAPASEVGENISVFSHS